MQENKKFFHLETLEEVSSSPESHLPAYEQITLDNKKSYKCLTEGRQKIFRFRSDMERHIIVHSNQKQFYCKYPGCDKRFKRPDSLKGHIKMHEEGLLACDLPGCTLRSHQKLGLKEDISEENNEENYEEKFYCDFPGCKKSFRTLKYLKQHQKKTRCHENLLLKHDAIYIDSSDEDSSPTPQKFLNKEGKRAANSREFSKEKLDLWGKCFAQVMMCKDLFDENQSMRAKLSIETSSIKAKYEDSLREVLNDALKFGFDLSDDDDSS